jgi:hypothetical protein
MKNLYSTARILVGLAIAFITSGAFAQTVATQESATPATSVTLPADARCFKAEKGEARIIVGKPVFRKGAQAIANELFISTDGKTFREVFETSRESTKETCVISFVEDGKATFKETKVSSKGSAVTFCGVSYKPSDCPKTIQAVTLPGVRIPLYLFKMGEEFVCITCSKYRDYYNTWQVFVGPMNRMKRYAATEVEQNTRTVTTHAGVLTIPASGNATWLGRQLTTLDLKGYTITEGSTMILKNN